MDHCRRQYFFFLDQISWFFYEEIWIILMLSSCVLCQKNDYVINMHARLKIFVYILAVRTVRTERITRALRARINLIGLNGAIFSQYNVEEPRQLPSVILICAAASAMSGERKMVPCSIIKNGSYSVRDRWPDFARKRKAEARPTIDNAANSRHNSNSRMPVK